MLIRHTYAQRGIHESGVCGKVLKAIMKHQRREEDSLVHAKSPSKNHKPCKGHIWIWIEITESFLKQCQSCSRILRNHAKTFRSFSSGSDLCRFSRRRLLGDLGDPFLQSARSKIKHSVNCERCPASWDLRAKPAKSFLNKYIFLYQICVIHSMLPMSSL